MRALLDVNVLVALLDENHIDATVANCAHAQPVFYGFARLAHGKVNFRQCP